MKTSKKRALKTVCSLALALTPFFQYSGVSFLFFGEPAFPSEK